MVLSISIMRNSWGLNGLAVFAATVCFCEAAQAQNLNTIGITLLQSVTTNLNGTGIMVAQVEAVAPTFEVNPAVVNQPANLFTYLSAAGSANTFPNSVGNESGHADNVGNTFYGLPGGVATNVAHVDNYAADFFYTNCIANSALPGIGDAIVNQSFTFSEQSVGGQQQLDSEYDNYAVQNKTLFVSAANNYGTYNPPISYSTTNVVAPGTSYNCISVGSYLNGFSGNSLGPTIDNGRCKPDITAASYAETSFTTPQVAGAAAVLMQAGLRGDGGSDTSSAADMRTIKALLLNGAVKPADWTNVAPAPLDYRYGTGVLNVFNSYEQLTGGKHGYIVSTTVFPTGGAHLPTGATGTIGVLNGWDFNTNSSGKSPSHFDAVNHYYFNVSNSLPGANFTATASLVWNRQKNQTAINNLSLFLYNCANSNLVMCSTSLVDNVEHIFVPQLAQGRYDLQVWKAGGAGIVSAAEPYALAWEFFSQSLNIAATDTNVTLAWPVYPAGFQVEATASLTPPVVWETNDIPVPVIANGSNYIFLTATNATRFFQLSWPNL
jgi:hypothetical protein